MNQLRLTEMARLRHSFWTIPKGQLSMAIE